MLADMSRVGLCVDHWVDVMPERRVGEMLERRLERQLPRPDFL